MRDVVCQLGGAATRRYGRTVGAQDISPAAYIEVGSFSSGTSPPDVCHAEDNGQCGNILRPPRAFHIHFQVFDTFTSRIKLIFLLVPSRRTSLYILLLLGFSENFR